MSELVGIKNKDPLRTVNILMREKGDGPYHSSVTLQIWQHGAKENYSNFAASNRVVDTKTWIIQMGPNIINNGLENESKQTIIF